VQVGDLTGIGRAWWMGCKSTDERARRRMGYDVSSRGGRRRKNIKKQTSHFPLIDGSGW
jgi:hypothetical protein